MRVEQETFEHASESVYLLLLIPADHRLQYGTNPTFGSTVLAS